LPYLLTPSETAGRPQTKQGPRVQPLAVLKGHSGIVLRVRFSPDGKLLATGSVDGTAALWDAAGKRLHTLRGHRGVLTLAFHPDGSRLATGGAGELRGWSTKDGRPLPALTRGLFHVVEVAFGPRGDRLATAEVQACEDGAYVAWVREWDARTGKWRRTLGGPRDRFDALAYSPDGRWLAGGGQGRRATVWGGTAGGAVRTLPRPRGHFGAPPANPPDPPTGPS